MTSTPRKRGPKKAVQVSKSVNLSISNRTAHCRKRRSRRAVDRSHQLTFRRPIPKHFYEIATKKGYSLQGRGRRSSDLQLHCKRCDQLLQVRRSVLRDNALQCSHCLWISRFGDALATGATIVAPDRQNHKIAHILLFCGHPALRQYARLQAAAKGGHALGCTVCREARYAAQAKGSGWELIGPTANNKAGYRSYQHTCGHYQAHAIVNVDNRQLDCASCGETWCSKPSKIYLFSIPLKDQTVLKLGYSSNPQRRLRQQLGHAAQTGGTILRVIEFLTGHAALKAEIKAHRTLRKNHPEMVVERSVFAGQIKTKSEIYYPAAKAVILSLMDQIKDQTPTSPMTSKEP